MFQAFPFCGIFVFSAFRTILFPFRYFLNPHAFKLKPFTHSQVSCFIHLPYIYQVLFKLGVSFNLDLVKHLPISFGKST